MPQIPTFTIPPHLNKYHVPLSTFKASNPQWTNFVVGGLVFSHSPPKVLNGENEKSEPRVLLLQRALTDSLPGYWEGPGGGCEDRDESILAAVAREVLEESGLHVSRMVDLVGVAEWVKERNGTMFFVVKLTFLVEVYEAQETTGEMEGEAVRRWEDRVRLEPTEHSMFEWASEEQVRLGLGGKGKYKFLKEEGRNLLKAFRMLGQ
ncbi:NUDIX hydrolase domain-like protein [Aspergillus coremiiformis]|uniref:NUDIX hydrolase domain-like protein n=1 Tax=Aspergillus coremiiformis TaxID=138285 RepID=A0A5N6ZJF2_9EURO|nr:NUDIX hydrolase domain-like protein [Aspergillus coremiiformis]